MQKILRVLFLVTVILASFATLPTHPVNAFAFAAEINKRFDPPQIVAGEISTLIITIYNSNDFALENASFTDSIIGVQPGLRIASPANASTDCGGTLVAPSGGTTITFSGGVVPARTTVTGTCVIRVDVTSTTVGNLINTIPAYGVAPSYGGVGLYATARGGFDVITNTTPADATLIVTGVANPTMSKSLAPNTVYVGQYSVLTITVRNNDPDISLTETSYTDNLPTSFKIANPASVTTSGCGSPTVNAVVDSTFVSMSDATILPQTDCIVQIRVVSGTQGQYTNTIPGGPNGIGSLRTRQGVTNASDVSAPINVQAVRIDKSFNPTIVQQGDTSTLTITLRNPTGAPYNNIGLIDTLPTGVTVFGTPLVNQCGGTVSSDAGSLTLSGGTIPAGTPTTPGTCTVVAKVTSMAVGTHTNQILANTMTGDVTNAFPTSADLTVQTRTIGVVKQFGADLIQGGTTSLSITLQNMASTTLTGVNFTDVMPTNVFVIGTPVLSASCGGSATVTSDGNSISVSNAVIPPGSIAIPGTCTITATVGSNSSGTFTNCIDAGSVDSDQSVSNTSASCDSFRSFIIGSPASVSKSFSPSTIVTGSSTLLRINITSPNDTRLTGISITDTLPDDLLILGAPAPSTTCGGSLTAAAGTNLIQLTGGSTSSAGASCRIDVYVTSSMPGTHRNTIPGGTLTSNEGRSDYSDRNADLSVTSFNISKSFTPSAIKPGGISRLSIALSNSNTVALENVELWDYLSSMGGTTTDGVFLAADPNPTTTCGSGSVTTSGTQTIHMSGGTIPAGDGVVPGLCTINISVTGDGSSLTRTNTIYRTNVTGTINGTAITLNPVADAQANLRILDMSIGINKDFVPENMTGGLYSRMDVKLINPNAVPLSDITFTDDMPNGIVLANPPSFDGGACGGTFTILDSNSFKYSGGSLPANSECTVTLNVGMTVTGNLTNVIPAGAVTTMEGATNPLATQKSLTNLAGASISKSFAPNPVAIGQTSVLTITINNQFATGLTGMGLVDTLPSGLLITNGTVTNNCGGTLTATQGSALITLVNGSLAPTSSCTMLIPVSGAAPGSYANLIPPSALDTTEDVTNEDPASDTLVVYGFSLGNRIWEDNGAGTAGIANNGIMDGSEPGLSGRIVRLYNASDLVTVIDTTTSDSLGYYRFDDLVPGDYVVEVAVPVGYIPSTTNGGDPDNNIDLDNNGVSVVAGYARSNAITIESTPSEPTNDDDPSADSEIGEVPDAYSNRTLDFSFFKPFSLGNRVWNDNGGGAPALINNGLRDIGEPGMSGVLVRLYQDTGTPDGVPDGSALAFQVTDTSGYYRFDDLVAGNYIVEIVPPVGFVSSSGSTGDNNVDNNDNGAVIGAGYIRSNTIALGPGGDEPTNDDDPTTDPQVDESPDAYSNRTIDFGLTQSYSLGNRVWNDNGFGGGTANDGIRDSGEPGLANITVNLYQSGTLIDTVITDGNGYYRFDDLLSGDYTVGVVVPSGFASSAISVATPNNNTDNDNNGTTTVGSERRSGAITLGPDNSEPENDDDPATNPVAGEAADSFSNRTLDFGLYATPFSLGNRVWNDNGGGVISDANNGVIDFGEPGIANATVRIYVDANNDNTPDNTVPFATQLTDAQGYYRFDNLVTGNYIVEVLVPSGFVSSTTNESDPDSNGNFNDNGVTVLGSYIRSNAITLGPTGNEPALDADPTTDLGTAEAPAGYTNRTLDFGFAPLASIGDRVWLDTNQNGIQDTGETGLTGVTVDLYDSVGYLRSAVTTGGGVYSFTNLVPGDYHLLFNLPAGGYSFSTANVGGDDIVDSDANVTTGVTVTTTLSAGENDITWDAGMYLPPAQIGNFVWDDFYLNGVQDLGETGLWNVEVNLFRPGYGFDGIPSTADDDLPVSSVNTDGTGFYEFTGLIPGDYYVQVTAPSGYKITLQNQGGDDLLDSDANRTTGETTLTTLDAGENDPSWDVGLYQIVTIGDTVWVDVDMDGIQDVGEDGLDGVVVNLYASDGSTLIASTTTTTVGGLPGQYLFTDLDPGAYVVEFLTPGGYAITQPDQGTDESLDSNADLATGRYTTIAYNAGETDRSIDAGYYPLARLGNWVWEDRNHNGIQELGEPGIDGVTVTLLDNLGATLGTTVTSGGGFYEFVDLEPGNYSLNFGALAGYSITAQNSPSDDTLDSDADMFSGDTGTITLTPGQNDTSWDAGYYMLLAAFGDRVWLDVNGNGIQESGETGINDVTVYLKNSSGGTVATTTTYNNGSEDGVYDFTNLVPDYYYVQFDIPTGYAVTLPDQGGDDTLDSDVNRTTHRTNLTQLSPNEFDISWDMGLFQSTAIGDRVWVDANANGFQDAGENGLSGVTVDLYLTGFGQIATTTTNASGLYQFIDLVPGEYHLDFTLPSGYQYSPQNVGADDTVDSDVDPATGETINTDLASDEMDLSWDLGVYQLASIGDRVWVDLDADGIQDVGESGRSGVTVNLFNSSNTLVGTTTTNASGIYAFNNLLPGDYHVEITIPGTFYVSPLDVGSDTTDNDANSSGVMTTTTLVSGEIDTSWDAGIYQLAAIGDRVWLDNNGNGRQDGGETGIPGVTVTLYNSIGTSLGTTTTDASGLYNFNSLTPATYSVGFTLPGSYHFTQRDAAGGDTGDSDPDRTTGRTINTALTSNETDNSWDAGMYLYAEVGDYVWIDTDGDGIQDAGESPLAGVTVRLYTSGGSLIGTTTTDATGAYLFTNVEPGSYYINFGAVTDYARSVQDRGSDNTLDSDGNQSTGITATFALTSGQTDHTWDQGYYVPASIGDVVWDDLNADGIQDIGEPGVSGVRVDLFRPGFGPDGIAGNADDANSVAFETTASDGSYLFDNLNPGTYYLDFVLPTDFTFSLNNTTADSADSDADPATGTTADITVLSGDSDLTWDAGMYEPTSIGDFVWVDMNANGVQDSGELGFAGVTVGLYQPDGTLVESVVTDSNGLYLFEDLVPGIYYVAFDLPAGYNVTPSNQPSDDSTDSDVNPLTNATPFITLVSGTPQDTWDAGYYQVANIGDFVWVDDNANGSQDTGETGLSGVTVTLLDGSGNTLDTTTTNGSGGYSFTDLVPGTYAVNFTLPSGYSFSPRNSAGDPLLDSDPDTSTGTTTNISLFSGESQYSWDAGLYQFAEVGDYVWIDTNGNGILDLGEHPLEGVTVTLYTAGNVLVDSILTDQYGQYLFGGITPGEYYIVFSDQAGYSRTLQNQGVDDEADSDGDPITGRTTNFTLVSNEVNHTFDNGYYVVATIGNFVWEDLNFNGIQDAGEPGIDGVTVSLFDADNNQVGSSVTTSGGGFYSFTGLIPGNYHVEVVIPTGYLVTTQGVGGDMDLDSDIDAAGETIEITLVSGQTDNSWDAGLYQLTSIGDFAWVDTNANGAQDPGEPGLAGVTVDLYQDGGAFLATVETAADGSYQFTDLVPGIYYLDFELPTGYNFTPNNQLPGDSSDSDADPTPGFGLGTTPDITLVSGVPQNTWDAGYYQVASIGDRVWVDGNGNGVQDGGELGISGVDVELFDNLGNSAGTDTTLADGSYLFTDLVPGSYSIQFTLHAGYHFSPQDAGTDSTDSDPDPSTGRTVSTTLVSNENDLTWDAGVYQTVEIGDRVWEDLNANGIQDTGEPGIPGITVNLICPTCIGITTTTDSNGNYLFTDLDPGDYVVEFGLPANRVFSPADQGTDDAKDCDVISGYRTGTITLESNDSNMTVDAGMYTLASISDRVWNDLNSNGIQDGGEPGLSGITVHLYDGDGNQITTTITDANGIYLFNNLVPGDYSLSFDLLTNYLFSPINQGGNDSVDSDVNPANGTTVETTLISNEHDTSWDAGMFQQNALIGISKRVVGTPVEDTTSPGTWHVTYEFLVRNYSNVPLTNVQVTDDLTTTFPPDVAFTVTSITSDDFAENTLFTGVPTNTELLLGTDTLDVGEEGTIQIEFTVIPTSAGPYNNSAVASGQPPLGGPTSDISQDGTSPDPDTNGNPTDNSVPTPIDFGPNLFDPPFGVKEFDASGLPIIHWTMDWINDTNVVAIEAAVSDPIPSGTRFYDDGIPSGYPLPATYPTGSVNTGVGCTSASQITTTTYCYYEGPTGSYPYGRIVWQGTLGPDLGVRDPEVAVNDIRIEFNVTKLDGIRTVRNVATIDSDRNGDEDVLDPGEVRVATADAAWFAPSLPSTGFAPNRMTLIEQQPVIKQYNQMSEMTLEIPSLGVNLAVTGVPVVDNEWDLTWLGAQAGYLEGTAFPTHAGNSVITGHVYLPDGKPGPFVDLNKMKYGDQIIIHAYGQKYVYEVRGTGQLAPDTKDAFPHESYPVISLLTCQGFDETTGEYAWRYVVRAIQVKVEEE